MLLNDKEKVEIFRLWNDENWTKAGLARAYGVSARTIGRVIDALKSENERLYGTIGREIDEQKAEQPEKDNTPEYKYDIVATKNVINIYRTDQNDSGDIASAVVQKSENERLYNDIYQDLKQGVGDQNVLEACFNKINLKTYIESVSLGNIKVAPTEGLVYYEGEDGERVSFSGGLVDRIIRLVKEAHETDTPYAFNGELTGLQKFAERLKNNPSQRAINELYDFIKHSDILIREDGMVECYKRIRGDFMDIYTGTMDNSVGQVVEIPRDQVDPDANRTCSYGLHVCSKTYLPFYGVEDSNVTVKVLVDPADFVAIPTDYNQPVIGCEEGAVAPAKARVCRYEVIGLATDAELL